MADQALVVRCFMMSIDGFCAGEHQRLDAPFGDHVDGLREWIFATRSGKAMIGQAGGADNGDEVYVAHAFDGIGAVILGRNMFTTSRGPWTDDGWVGWWGPNPPYHAPSIVLTHYARDPLVMEGGTTFHFATGGIEDALGHAFGAAGGADVRLMGGAAVLRQYLAARLVDRLHLAVAPMLIGRGERVFPDVSPPGYRCVDRVTTDAVTHLHFERS